MENNPHPWGWTAERRARQAAAIRRWQPWRSSTGPKSAAGKTRSSQNASKPGSVAKQVAEIKADLTKVRRMIRAITVRRGLAKR